MGRPQPLGHDAIRIKDWPEADRAALATAERPTDLLDDGGRAASWRPATRHSLVATYGRWLGFLVGQGFDLATETPAERVTPERIRDYRRFLRDRCAPVTVASYLGQLHMFMVDVWPERSWDWLSTIQSSQQRMAEPRRDKLARMVPLADVVRLGFDLMDEAEQADLDACQTAGPDHPSLRFRDGLIIAVLALRPLRQRNLLGLRLGVQLRRAPDGWEIHIPAAEHKTHTPLTLPFPEMLLSALERYLAVHRPRLMAMRGPIAPARASQAAVDALWVTRCGTAMTAGALQKLLSRHGRARFGRPLTCHMFRDIAATEIAEAMPKGRQLAADLLGHRNIRTTERHYIAARQKEARRQCQAEVERLRRAFRSADQPSRRDRSGLASAALDDQVGDLSDVES